MTRPDDSKGPQRIVLITGMSGGGKGTAARALEDAGWFCIDNLPVPVIPKLLEMLVHSQELENIALVVDARERRHIGETPQVITEARAGGHQVEVLFVDANDETLIRRFSETRRRHPLAEDGKTMPEGIAAERALLTSLRSMADEVVDTSGTNVHELKQIIQARFAKRGDLPALDVTVTSFGYRYGLPPQADLVFDVRFLPNPYFVPELKASPGTDPAVSEWVLGHEVSQQFLAQMRQMLTFLLPRYRDEGKAYLTVALGCTGGRHRSVALAEALSAGLLDEDVRSSVRHRDVHRGS